MDASRRRLLKGAGAAAALLLGACASASQPRPTSVPGFGVPDPPTTAALSPGTTGSPPAGRLLGYAFNSGDQSVTLFDAASRQPLETRPLGATVQWLSTEQRFWDGQYIWTYAYPDDIVQAIGIEPRSLRVARTIPTGGKGPAHSLMLTNDRKTAWVNVAGENYLAVLDVASGQVAAQVKTGKFP